MTATVMERLTRLQRYATCYELAIRHADGRTYLLAYCGSKSRETVFRIARKHGTRIVEVTGVDQIFFAKRSADGAIVGDWRIVWTGRTERDAITNGELPFIAKQA